MTISEGEEPNRRVVLVPAQDGASQRVPAPTGEVFESTAAGTHNDAGTLANEEPEAAEAAGQGVGSQQ
jgi:hypothetical protein